MGDADARVDLARMCPAGHLTHMMLCSQKFILGAASGQDAMANLMGASNHLLRMSDILMAGAAEIGTIGDCLSKSLFMLDKNQMLSYLDRVLDENNQIRVDLFQNGIDLDALLYRQELTRHRGDIPHRERACLPIKDPQCFPRSAAYPEESCSACCDPLASKDLQCWMKDLYFLALQSS